MKFKHALIGALFAAACNPATGPTPVPVSMAAPAPVSTPKNFTLTGEVKGFGGGSVNGAKITFQGMDGETTGLNYSAIVVGDTYSIDRMQPGNYRSSITWDGSVPRVDESIEINGPSRSFSVLKWNDIIDGVRYDNNYDRFFNKIARGSGYVSKWDMERKPLREIRIVTGNMPGDTLQRVHGYFQSLNLRDYFDRDISVPVNMVADATDADGKILVMLATMNPDWLATATAYEAGGRISGCAIKFNEKYFKEKTFLGHEEGAINHEFGHCVFMDHVGDEYIGQSVMSGSLTLTPYDRAAARIVYGHAGFRNMSPDTNPRTVGAASRATDACVYKIPGAPQ